MHGQPIMDTAYIGTINFAINVCVVLASYNHTHTQEVKLLSFQCKCINYQQTHLIYLNPGGG